MQFKTSVARREWLQVALGTVAYYGLERRCWAADRGHREAGQVIGEPTAELAGTQVLIDGGNAIDAIVTAALVAAVAAPHQTGIGGYGMSAMIAFDAGRQFMAIDGNSTAPAAMQTDIFRDIAEGRDRSGRNATGWLSAGVPGILSGLFLAAERFGTRPFAQLLQPAIELARNGFPWPASLVGVVRKLTAMRRDPGSERLYWPQGRELAGGEIFRNPELAEMLMALARANSVEPFYRGDIALRIAEAFQNSGGLVTAQDLALHRATLVQPIVIPWQDLHLHTAPLTAGGLTVFQILRCLESLDWYQMAGDDRRVQALMESARLAWYDRLTQLGDPQQIPDPTERLLSLDYAVASADRVRHAIDAKAKLQIPAVSPTQKGTISLSAVDRDGNMAALTLTHGEAFGSKVTVNGLGLTLGHGVSRFDVHPNHPNSPGPGKRPLHNMVPVIASRNLRACMAVGGRGGRKIPNAVLAMLLNYGSTRSLSQAIAAPRFHTEGDSQLQFEAHWPAPERKSLEAIGYSVQEAGSATLSAVAIEREQRIAAMR